jgi:hypothetical protein
MKGGRYTGNQQHPDLIATWGSALRRGRARSETFAEQTETFAPPGSPMGKDAFWRGNWYRQP